MIKIIISIAIFSSCMMTQPIDKKIDSQSHINDSLLYDSFTSIVDDYNPKGAINTQPDTLIHITSEIIIGANNYDSIGTLKYTALCLLKLYLAHLKCCNQSYEIRRHRGETDPLLNYFFVSSRLYKANPRTDFIPSSIGYNWVKSSDFRNDPLLKPYIDKIEEKSR